mmetsp:Transcript_10265/g.15457  ORF Transcript_10265/g.15457 Transcript_10265/m.15457 type:complete len:113 (-) Transcript_10265:250-588(-)
MTIPWYKRIALTDEVAKFFVMLVVPTALVYIMMKPSQKEEEAFHAELEAKYPNIVKKAANNRQGIARLIEEAKSGADISEETENKLDKLLKAGVKDSALHGDKKKEEENTGM